MRTFTEIKDSPRRESYEAQIRESGKSNTVNFVSSITSDLTPEGRRQGNVTKAQFEPIGEKSTHVGWGIVHLYRDDKEAIHLDSRTTMQGGEDECTTLCIPAVPSYLTPNYFLTWVGDQTVEQVSHFRMMMTEHFMRYLVLMKFRDGEAAKSWKQEWNGRPFNCMEPETCHVVFIKSISFSTPPSTTILSSSFPALKHDPFTPPAAPLVELPTCPVCLERMDDTTGLLTILCQHVFHCACLMKWKDSSCPVCRHTNSSSIDSDQETPFGSGEASLCITCDCADDLWICLICGNVGCGRYKGGHAKEHWKETAHCYALEIETQYVWDYAGDVWVHRLIRDKGDSSKIVELPSRPRRGIDSDRANLSSEYNNEELVSRNKLDVISIEYTHILTSQLESQRIYFENLLSKSVAEAATAYSNSSSAAISESSANEKIKALEQANATLKSEFIEQTRNLEREKRRADKSTKLAHNLSKNLIEERHVGEGLLHRIEHLNRNIDKITKQHEILKAENCELRETNRDLLFSLSAGEKVREIEADEGSGLVHGELETGVLSLPDPAPGKGNEKTRCKTKGKGKAK